MQYYLFTEACATKETGPISPQIQKWKPGYKDDKADSYYSYYDASDRGCTFPDFAPDMDALVMHGKAKPTDLVSSGLSIGFIISKKLKALFEQFNFPAHRFYPTKIIHKKTEVDEYFLMHIASKYYEDYLDFVDYSKSLFLIAGIAKSDPHHITLNSKRDYLDKANQLQNDALTKKVFHSIYAEKICFNTNFDESLDCFKAPFGVRYYISQRLKDALIENNITGCYIHNDNLINFN
jgi:hypothetical protein